MVECHVSFIHHLLLLALLHILCSGSVCSLDWLLLLLHSLLVLGERVHVIIVRLLTLVINHPFSLHLLLQLLLNNLIMLVYWSVQITVIILLLKILNIYNVRLWVWILVLRIHLLLVWLRHLSCIWSSLDISLGSNRLLAHLRVVLLPLINLRNLASEVASSLVALDILVDNTCSWRCIS